MISKRQLLKAAALTLMGMPLAGCVSNRGGWFNAEASVDAVKLSSLEATAIAHDMTDSLSGRIGPGAGTIWLKGDGSPFEPALEEAMRSAGYAVASANQRQPGNDIIPLAYVIDHDGSEILVRITMSNIELSRSYATTSNGVSPASPLSVLTRAT